MWVWKINGKKIMLPTGWHEVLTKDYQRLKSVKDSTNRLEVFSALVDMPFDHIIHSRDEELSMTIYQICAFIFNSPEYFRDAPVPKRITLVGKTLELPTQLEKLTVEQNILVRSRMDEVTYLEELISFACAVYMQPLFDDNKFNADRVAFWEWQIGQLPIEYTFPVGFFFLTQIKNYGNFGWASLIRQIIHLWKWKRRRQGWRMLSSLRHIHT